MIESPILHPIPVYLSLILKIQDTLHLINKKGEAAVAASPLILQLSVDQQG
jgi:hypothetical protein